MSSITTHPLSRVGTMVIYKLNRHDAEQIVRARIFAGQGTANGNAPREGDEYPALIIRDFAHFETHQDHLDGKFNRADGSPITWEDHLAQAPCNLQVFLDGNDVYWATSRLLFRPNRHGDWSPLPFGQAPANQQEEDSGIWTPDARGRWFIAGQAQV